MPRVFKERGNVSMLELFRQSGYLENAEAITEASLEAHLRANPDLVDVWHGYSQDQRCTPAWYLSDQGGALSGDSEWFVGYLPGPGAPARKRPFPNRYSASAHFIKMFVESLRGMV